MEAIRVVALSVDSDDHTMNVKWIGLEEPDITWETEQYIHVDAPHGEPAEKANIDQGPPQGPKDHVRG